MTTSKTIAGLIGPTLVAIASGMLLNIGSLPALAELDKQQLAAGLRMNAHDRMFEARKLHVAAFARSAAGMRLP